MKVKAIVCDIFFREFSMVAATSPATVDAVFVKKGLHDKPAELRDILQEEIDRTPDGEYDAIALVYGLCGKSTDGLVSRHTRVVLPRVHDCIAVFLGSLQEYMSNFREHPGTYYYTSGAWERGGSLGAEASGADDARMAKLAEYTEKYGEENAAYLLEMESSWTKHYTRAAYIGFDGLDFPGFEGSTKEVASERGLAYERIHGRFDLIDGLLRGNWDQRFVVIEPGYSISATDGHDVMKSSCRC